MAIGDLTALPVGVANAIQQNMLARKWMDTLFSIIAYSREASWIPIPAHIGATYTFTKLGELPVSRTALDPTQMNGLDNGLTTDALIDEQFTFKLARFAKTFDIDILAQKAMIANYVMQVIERQARQAARTREAVCRYKLTNAYMAGTTIVTNSSSPTTTQCHVDDIRGFTQVMVNGTLLNVSAGAGLQLSVTDQTNTAITLNVTGVTPDSTSATPETDPANLSSAKAVGGVSGILIYQTVVTPPSVGDQLQAVNCSVVLRPNGKQTTQALAATDVFNTMLVMTGKQQLASRGVRPYADGWYRCILPPSSMTQLFTDPDFKLAFQGQQNSPEFRNGEIVRYQGVEYIQTTEAIVQAKGAGSNGAGSLVNVNVNRPILLGKEAITRGDFEGLEEFVDEKQKRSTVHDSHIIDGIEFTIRSPIDRLGEILSSSWQMINDYCPPSDATTTPATVPTADLAMFKKAIQFEHAA